MPIVGIERMYHFFDIRRLVVIVNLLFELLNDISSDSNAPRFNKIAYKGNAVTSGLYLLFARMES